jgi:hypothetical protein
VRDSCAKHCARSIGTSSPGECSLHAIGSHDRYRPDPVPVVAVEGLPIVTEEVGHLLDRGPSVEKERDCAVAQPVGDRAPRPSEGERVAPTAQGRGRESRPRPRKCQVKGLIAGNGRLAFHHPVAAHTPRS